MTMSDARRVAAQDSGFFTKPLSEADPEIYAAIEQEHERQQDEIELIASENIVSKAVLDAAGTLLTNKYAEGYPGKRYYGGCQYVDIVEQLVAWILRDTPGWDYERIVSMKRTGEQIDVKLTKQIPVYFTYISAWSTPDGIVQFRPDIYNLDGASATASAY